MRSLKQAHIGRNWASFLSYLDRRLQGIQTNLPGVDRYLLGLGGICTFQGDTGTNKSTLALQVLHEQLKLGNPGLILDKENSEGRLRSRLVCQSNLCSETDLLSADIDRRRDLVTPVMDLPLYIYTENTPDFAIVEERVMECFTRHDGRPLTLLIDSLQAMTPVDSDQRVNLEKWMIFLDTLKVQYDGKLTILITSETKRAGYESDEGIGRGKGTNAIEFKSETLLDMREDKETGLVKIQVAKHRDGVKGAIFYLERRLVDPANKRSFCFLLQEASNGFLENLEDGV